MLFNYLSLPPVTTLISFTPQHPIGLFYFMATYAQKLTDPRWQKKRLEILSRDEFKCQYCGETTKTLHVHHYSYNKSRNPWDCEDGDVTTLCEECHYIYHIKDFTKLEDEIISVVQFHSMCGLPKDVTELLRHINSIILKHKPNPNGK